MSILQALVLGVVQGLTEFLPVSSDGHLAVAYRLFGTPPNLAFEVLLHFGTLVALIVYFRDDLTDLVQSVVSGRPGDAPKRRVALLIGIGTVATVGVALALDPVVEPMSADMRWVGLWFLVTGAVLALAEWLGRVRERDASAMTWWQSVLVGLGQGAAVLPGLSRSGTTIATGMLVGLDRAEAARFSFLLGIPIIAAAEAKSLLDVVQGSATLPGFLPSVVGLVAAGVTGYLAVAGLLTYVKKHSLTPFAIYVAVVAVLVLAWQLLA